MLAPGRGRSNIEWGKMKKQTYDLEERLVEKNRRKKKGPQSIFDLIESLLV